MTLGKNIKKYRKEAGLTQKALANQSGLSFSMVSKLESGEQSNPSYETLKKIADILKISPAKLVSVPMTIEEQIDDYIEYKRGLNQKYTKAETPDKTKSPYLQERKREPCADLNFMKKLQAINTIPKPKDEFEEEYFTCLQKRPEIRRLFSSIRDASKEEVEQIISFAEAFQRH